MRAVRREPDFDEAPARRTRRAASLDGASRTVLVRNGRGGRPGGRKASRGEDGGWRFLPRLTRLSPGMIAMAGFLLLAAGAGLIQGGHLSFGGGDAKGEGAVAASEAWFPIGEILASGHYHTRRADLLTAIGFKPGDDMLDAGPEEIRLRVEALEWIDSAKVSRLWPATLKVDVVEKEPYALWQTKGVTWLIDRKGEKITKDDIAEFAGLPLVVGDGAPRHAGELIDILMRFPAIQRVTKASVRVGDRRWDLHLKNGIQVRLPEDGVEDALRRLTVLEQEQRIFERDIETIDLRLPDRLVIKPRGGAAESIARGEST
ncbi:MAG: cell division protein FtsQ/DivIB [Alphaproteobacteria bacterium]